MLRVTFLAMLFLAGTGYWFEAPAHGQGTEGARAEGEQDFAALERRGFEALGAGRIDEASAAFARCLELRPSSPSTAYNLACCHALDGEIDAAFEWLEKSIGWGFDQPNWMSTDSDLQSLRHDARFVELVEAAKKKLMGTTRSSTWTGSAATAPTSRAASSVPTASGSSRRRAMGSRASSMRLRENCC